MAKAQKAPPPEPGCPDDPKEVCKWFIEKAAVEWYVWTVHAHLHYHELGCANPDHVRPPLPTLSGCGETEDCREVCKRIGKWAKDLGKWAKDFNKALDDCLEDWSPTNPVPDAPTGRCQTCEEACAAVRTFHAPLEAWAKEVRERLNEDPDLPHLVPPPPPPP